MNKSEQKRQKFKDVLTKYLPAFSIEMVCDLILQHPLNFKIVKPRKRKLGDYRFNGPGERPQITINGNLNPYQFLITTIHELAHAEAFRIYGPKIAPHGKEWQSTYRNLCIPFIKHPELPNEIAGAWQDSLIRVKASSCSDATLSKTLFKYNKNSDAILLEQIPLNGKFYLEGHLFSRGSIRRKRYLCTRVSDGRKYLVSSIAEVKKFEHE